MTATLLKVSLIFIGLFAVVAAFSFPYDVDAPLSAQEMEKARKYYAAAYQPSTAASANSQSTTKYLQVAEEAEKNSHITEQVQDFVNRFHLQQRAVLDIGSGRGYLQDLVENYTGLDISPAVARFYHKKFVLGSATAMPFPDNTFDAAWSIFVFEHVPNPEQALRECRRVLRDGAEIMLLPAWNVPNWAADGYPARPYSDFNFSGKLIKASIPFRTLLPVRAASRVSARMVRATSFFFGGPSTLHYRRLNANYKDYWMPDSDAVNSLDRYEVMAWFRSRGDECLTCDGLSGSVFMSLPPYLIVRIHKRSA
jgi:SAM-dependent methyltransferase